MEVVYHCIDGTESVYIDSHRSAYPFALRVFKAHENVLCLEVKSNEPLVQYQHFINGVLAEFQLPLITFSDIRICCELNIEFDLMKSIMQPDKFKDTITNLEGLKTTKSVVSYLLRILPH